MSALTNFGVPLLASEAMRRARDCAVLYGRFPGRNAPKAGTCPCASTEVEDVGAFRACNYMGLIPSLKLYASFFFFFFFFRNGSCILVQGHDGDFSFLRAT
jgi:hypothetical protein